MPLRNERIRTIGGSIPEDGAALSSAVRGQDAVVSAMGRGLSLKSSGLIGRAVPAILSAMQAQHVRRLIFTSAFGVGDSIEDASFPAKIMFRLLLRDIYADKAAGEALIRRSDLDWTIVQPAHLTSGPLTGAYRAGERMQLRGLPSISRADVAHFILRQLDDDAYIRKSAIIAEGSSGSTRVHQTRR
jgi:putative NADH-flavin reductase